VYIVYTGRIFQFCQHYFRYTLRFWNSLLLSWASVCVCVCKHSRTRTHTHARSHIHTHGYVTDTRTSVSMCGRTREDVKFVSW
jgi:hypothetical protein